MSEKKGPKAELYEEWADHPFTRDVLRAQLRTQFTAAARHLVVTAGRSPDPEVRAAHASLTAMAGQLSIFGASDEAIQSNVDQSMLEAVNESGRASGT